MRVEGAEIGSISDGQHYVGRWGHRDGENQEEGDGLLNPRRASLVDTKSSLGDIATEISKRPYWD
jgi:hypothetical protein